MIAWKELLLLLEGQPVHLLSPKNHFSSDLCISNDIPVFATSKSEIRYNSTDATAHEMMAARLTCKSKSLQILWEETKQGGR